MPRHTSASSVDDTIVLLAANAASEIADLVRAHVAEAVLRAAQSPSLVEQAALAVATRFAEAARAARAEEEALAAASEPLTPTEAVPASAAAPPEIAAPAAAEGAPAAAAAVPTRHSRPSPESDPLIASVRTQLSAAFFGRPVTAERLALLLRQDAVLVDAALVYLVGRKEVWQRNVKGKAAYVPRLY